jgi:hypothetical protein
MFFIQFLILQHILLRSLIVFMEFLFAFIKIFSSKFPPLMVNMSIQFLFLEYQAKLLIQLRKRG